MQEYLTLYELYTDKIYTNQRIKFKKNLNNVVKKQQSRQFEKIKNKITDDRPIIIISSNNYKNTMYLPTNMPYNLMSNT